MIPSGEELKLSNLFNPILFSKLVSKLISWVRYYICFCRPAALASGLVFGYKFVDFAVLGFLIIYFTNSSAYNLRKAAAFVNVREGLSASLVIVLIYISLTFFGRLKIIICSTASYIIAFVLLYLTASNRFPWSKSDLFNITGVVLLALGKAGVKTFLGTFLTDQLKAHEPKGCENEDRVIARKTVWWLVAWCCSVLAAFRLTYYYSWPRLFIFSAVSIGIIFILFTCGIRFYHSRELAGVGSQFPIFRVIKASTLKRHHQYPSSPNQFFRNEGNKLCLSPPVKILRWLDKAAIIESSNLSPEEQENAGRLCTVTEVQYCKLLFKMVPMWTTFLVFGLIVSTGETFFTEQGNNMDSPPYFILYLLIIPSISRKITGYLWKLLVSERDPVAKKQAQIVRMWAGKVLSIFCCTLAWRVEVHRLKIVNDNGLMDKPDDIIPMSIFWLAPQFCLLGLMQALASDGLDEFMTDQFPKSMMDYVTAINEFVIGIGSFLNILYVYANRSLFSENLNQSRMDKYYKTLTVVSFFNLCYYLLISTIYTRSDSDVEADEVSETFGRAEV